MGATLPASIGRGAALLAGSGALLGAVAGTIAMPVVATAIGAVYGGLFGGGVGVVDGLVLLVLVRRARSAWLARIVSAGVAGIAVALTALDADGLRPVATLATVAATVVAAGVLGPLIAFGPDPGVGDHRSMGSAVQRISAVCVGLGAVAGGTVGLVRGLDYVPTAVFAVFEGALIGAACGITLAAAIVAVAVLPRVRARR